MRICFLSLKISNVSTISGNSMRLGAPKSASYIASSYALASLHALPVSRRRTFGMLDL